MTDIATLGLSIDATQANQAVEALNRLDAAGQRVGASTDSLNASEQAHIKTLQAELAALGRNRAELEASRANVAPFLTGLRMVSGEGTIFDGTGIRVGVGAGEMVMIPVGQTNTR